jgi:mRNA-degrading endonuclease RelE of RelBE toxin-antitoxin system
MPVVSKLHHSFRKQFESLPRDIQDLAEKNYQIWKNDPFHPSLHFKKIQGSEYWSVRIGGAYRAVGLQDSDGSWIWLFAGKHDDYMRFLKGS